MSDLSAEKALLGCILAGYPDLDDLASTLQPGEFEQPLHEEIYAAALAVHQSGTKVDPVAVRISLGQVANRLPGGPTYLVDLTQSAPNVMSAGYYATEVRTIAARRHLNNVGLKLQQLSESDLPVDELQDRARSAFEALDTVDTSTASLTVRDVLPGVIDIAEHGTASGIPSPWGDLNRFIRGFAPGRLVVIGARPGVGKSVMGSALALATARDHHQPVLFCTMEMGATEVLQRILANHARVDLGRLEQGNLDQRSWSKLAAKIDEMHEWPIDFEDTSSQTLTSIRNKMRKTVRKYGHVPILIVDYLQQITPRDHTIRRDQQIGEITRGLKIIAGEFDTCVVAMAQVSRAATQRDRPTMADLRESGSIEADADAIILLHREPPTDAEFPPLEAIVAKQRNGPTGVAELSFIGHYAAIGDYTRHQEGTYR